MATNDLSNKQDILVNYLKAMAQQNFPNLDLSDHGAFMETFGTPHVELLQPLLEYADRVKLMQSIDNANLMTEKEMDEVGSRFFRYRKNGEFARGYVTILFDDIPANGVVRIPAGTEARSKQDYRFRSLENVILDEEELANYYDVDTFRYRIPVFFEAENPGKKYNVDENEVNDLVTPLEHVARILNEINFSGGKNKETNVQFAERIKETNGAANVGVEKGWKNFSHRYKEVQDVIVAGYGHPLMRRDIVGITPEGRFSSAADPEVHWGGKVDLHIRGKDLLENRETLRIQKDNNTKERFVLLHEKPVNDILEITFTSPRYTDPDLDESFFNVNDYLLMKNEDPETLGTLHEDVYVVIKDERLNTDDTVTIRYRYNNLIHDMNYDLYDEKNRPPTTDVLLKEARRKYLHGNIVIRLKSAVGLREKDRSAIRQRIYNWLEEKSLGGELQTSDLQEPIYEDGGDSVTRVDYISLPSQYIVTDHDNRFLFYCMSQDRREFLNKLEKESLYFGEWLPYFKDDVTIYDFFDIMHTLTYQNVTTDAWEDLSMRDHEWGKRVYFIDLSKRMLAYVDSLHRLSPAKVKTDANNYFELGHLTVFEDTPYSVSDLERFVNLFETIANLGKTEKNIDNMLHLTVYCSVLLYVMSAPDVSKLTVERLFEWLMDLTKGTPVDYQVHH